MYPVHVRGSSLSAHRAQLLGTRRRRKRRRLGEHGAARQHALRAHEAPRARPVRRRPVQDGGEPADVLEVEPVEVVRVRVRGGKVNGGFVI